MTRDTVGKISNDLIIKSADNTHSAHEQMQECLTDYDANINQCIIDHKLKFTGDFYIVVITKKERLMDNVLRNYFTARLSCPTPDYDQTVYKYTRKDDAIEFMWVIPSKDACITLKDNFLLIPSEERELLKFVLDFSDGTLFELAKKLNGEESLLSPMLTK